VERDKGDGCSWIHFCLDRGSLSTRRRQRLSRRREMLHVVSGTVQTDSMMRHSTSPDCPPHSHLPIHTMTSVNPSHNVFRHSEGRHAQAVHQSTQFPDDLPAKDDDSIDGDLPRVKKEARKRVRQKMPPMPDLRFEQVGQTLPYRHK